MFDLDGILAPHCQCL